jgi:hypothetical protein
MNDVLKTGVTLVVTVILSGLFSFVNFYEFIGVAVFHTAGYPFGTAAGVSWHYQSAERFSMYCLICGILFMIPLILSVWSYRNKRPKQLRTAFLLTVVLIVLSTLI